MRDKLKLPYADKSLGQHFLTNKSVIEKICNDNNSNPKTILEIGPGPGILTEFLSKKSIPYIAIEKDIRFKEYLDQFVTEKEVIFSDALKINLSELKLMAPIWLVSNLPYNISVPLLIKFIEVKDIKDMTLMFQKEVGQKLVEVQGKKNQMNSLMALTKTYFETTTLCKVSKGSFTPAPEVESIVIGLKRRDNPNISLDDFSKFESFLRIIFSHKRKQIQTILKTHYKIELISKALKKQDIKETARAETFSLQNVQNLYKILIGKEN